MAFWTKPGAAFSGLAHLAVLGFILFNLSLCSVPQPIDDTKDVVPVDVVTEGVNKTKAGDKDAQDAAKDAATRADKVAQEVEEHPPAPVPKPDETPPPPLPPTPPPPPPPPAPEPPPRPEAPTPPLPPSVPPPQPTPAPTPLPPPPPPKPVPEPPDLPKRAEVKPPPKPVKPPPPKPQPVERPPPEPTKVAKETPPPRPVQRPAAHPKPTPQPTPDRPFDPTDISKLLNNDTPTAALSTGTKLSRAATRGAASGHDQQMSPNLWDALDGLMQDQYKQCWSYLGITQTKYIPQIKVAYDADGSLASDPVLLNKPSDPALRSLAESALRAVRQCNPLKIPPQFAPYYDEWRARVLRFDPAEMAG